MTRPRFVILFLIPFQFALSSFATPQKPQPSQLPLPRIIVDPKLHPIVQILPHKEGEQKRLVAAVADAKGRQSEFVENELVVFSDDSAEVKKLATRWHGRIVSELDATKPHLKGAPAVHLVSIDSRLADSATLPPDRAASAFKQDWTAHACGGRA
jgi:hypothetical protein